MKGQEIGTYISFQVYLQSVKKTVFCTISFFLTVWDKIRNNFRIFIFAVYVTWVCPTLKPPNYCVFQQANVCLACHSLIESIVFTIKQIFPTQMGNNKKKMQKHEKVSTSIWVLLLNAG